MIVDSNFLSMEAEVIMKIIDSYHEYKDVLLQQYQSVINVERVFDACGFFTNLEVDKSKCIAVNRFLDLDIYGKLNDYIVVGFTLYIRGGYISELECYKFLEEEFPDKIEKYKLYKESPIKF